MHLEVSIPVKQEAEASKPKGTLTFMSKQDVPFVIVLLDSQALPTDTWPLFQASTTGMTHFPSY